MTNLDRGIVFRELERLFSDGTLLGLGDSQLLERYLTRRDEAAFEAIVNLHGPMVLGLCRRILRDPRDIEDAFQATFLVLVRKAAGIRNRTQLANWLYGVALKVARRARTTALRRRGREGPLGGLDTPARSEPGDAAGIGQVLDQELSRLPGKYRVPLVMCYLRGQTHDEAAAELAWPVGTVRSRMARGRELLRKRLTRRGVLPSAALLGPGPPLPADLFTAAVPPSLAAATVEGAFAAGSSQTVAGTAASVLALTQGVIMSMKLTQLKWIGLALVTTALSTGGAIVVASARSQAGPGADAALTVAPSGIEVGQAPAQSREAARRTRPAGSTEDRITALEQKMDDLFRASGMADRAPLPAALPGSTPLDRLERKIDFFWNLHFGPEDRTDSHPVEHPRGGVAPPPANRGGAVVSDPVVAKPALSAVPTDQAAKGARHRVGVAEATARPTGPMPEPRPGIAANLPVDQGDSPFRDPSPSRLANEPLDNLRGTGREIRELEALIKLALPELAWAEKMSAKGYMSERDLQARRSKVFGTIATLEGIADDVTEEIENVELEIRKRKAMVQQALAQREVAASVVARNTRLNQRKPGVVAEEDVGKAQADLKAAEAQVDIKELDLAESELRHRHMNERRARIRQIVKWATEAAAPARPGDADPATSAPSAKVHQN